MEYRSVLARSQDGIRREDGGSTSGAAARELYLDGNVLSLDPGCYIVLWLCTMFPLEELNKG